MKPETAIYTAYDDHVGLDFSEPEKNLMRAILKTAIEDLRKSGESHRDAYNFFKSIDETYVFSFRSICNHLNLCHKTVLVLCGLLGGGEATEKLPQPQAEPTSEPLNEVEVNVEVEVEERTES